MIKILILILTLWILLGIVVPFVLFPNYLFRPKIKVTKKVKQISSKLKSKNKLITLKNVYLYVVKHHYGIERSLGTKTRYLKNLFKYDVERNLDKKVPLFCHAQNLILKTLLINTGQFKDENITVKWAIGYDIIIHQYLLLRMGKTKIRVDPFYKIFKIVD